MHQLHVLATLLEWSEALTVTKSSEGPPGTVRAWRLPARLIPSHPVVDSIVLVGKIDGCVQGEGGRRQQRNPYNPKGRDSEEEGEGRRFDRSGGEYGDRYTRPEESP